MQSLIFLLVISLSAISVLAKIIKVQDPFFHATAIRADKMKCKCRHYLDLNVKENARALYAKMVDKEVHKVWVSKNKLVVREGRHIYVERKRGKSLKKTHPYICGSKAYKAILITEREGKEPTRKHKKGSQKFATSEKAETQSEVEPSASAEDKGEEQAPKRTKSTKNKPEKKEAKSKKEVEESSTTVSGEDSESINDESESSSSEDDEFPVIVYKKNVSPDKWKKIVKWMDRKDKSQKEIKIHRVVLSHKDFDSIFHSKRKAE